MERLVQFSLLHRLGDSVKYERVSCLTSACSRGGNPCFQLVLNADGRCRYGKSLERAQFVALLCYSNKRNRAALVSFSAQALKWWGMQNPVRGITPVASSWHAIRRRCPAPIGESISRRTRPIRRSPHQTETETGILNAWSRSG